MKFLKIIIGILIVVLSIVTTTLFLAYQTLNYSFLSYDENINALNQIDYKSYVIEQLAENQLDEIEGLSELVENTSIKDLNLGSLNYFIDTFIENSLSYLFLKTDDLEPFNKQFVDDFKNQSIASVINPILNNDIYNSLIENIDQVDPVVAKKALTDLFDNKGISYTDEEVEGIITNLYNGTPSKEKLRDELAAFIGNKIKIGFYPEKMVKRLLYAPRLATSKLAYIIGQLVLMEIGLLLLLLIVVLFNRNGVFASILITTIVSILLLQMLRLARSMKIMTEVADNSLLEDYYGYMSTILVKYINYISIAAIVFLVILIVINLVMSKRVKNRVQKKEKRYRFLRFIVSVALVVAISYVGYMAYSEVNETYQALEKYDIEKDLENIDGVFEFKFEL